MVQIRSVIANLLSSCVPFILVYMFFSSYSAAKIEGGAEPMDEDEDEEDGDGGSGVSKKDPSLRRSELLSKSGLAKVRNCFKLSSRNL